MDEHFRGSAKPIFTVLMVLFVAWAALELTGIDDDDDQIQTRSATQPTAAPPTSTPAPTTTPAELMEQAEYLDPRRLVADPAGFVGQNVIVQGNAREVVQKNGFTWLRLDAAVRERDLTEAIVVELRPPNPDILREECYRFYGIAAGTQRGVIRFGAALDPLVDAYAVEPSPRESSFCEAP